MYVYSCNLVGHRNLPAGSGRKRARRDQTRIPDQTRKRRQLIRRSPDLRRSANSIVKPQARQDFHPCGWATGPCVTRKQTLPLFFLRLCFFGRLCADFLLLRAAKFRLGDKRLNLRSEDENSARNLDRSQAAPPDQIGNRLLRYASDSRRFRLRNPVVRLQSFSMFCG